MWRFWVDTGGTFTDCLAEDAEGKLRRVKVLSSSCVRGRIVSRISDRRYRVEVGESVPDGFFVGYGFRLLGEDGPECSVTEWRSGEGVAALEGEISTREGFPEAGALCEFVSPEEPPTLAARLVTGRRLDEKLLQMEMRLATTRGTNALLERKGAKVAFFVTAGFGDLLRIGNQQRPDLFELGIRKPDPLADLVFEVDERMDATGAALRELDEGKARLQVAEALEAGAQAFAVAFLHSYRNPEHERRFADIAREMGVQYVSLSTELSPFVKVLPRAETAVVDAYLAPIMDDYLDAVQGAMGEASKLRVMTSAGGLVGRSAYHAKDSLLSGPAGGVVGSSRVGEQAGFSRSIAFDMGGTSTDVSRYDGQLDYRFEQRIGDARVLAPSLRIETVAAGGGSICWFDGSAIRVGPQSAGARPGPACYGAGGPLTITDVNLLLDRLDVSKFGIPVFPEAALGRFRELRTEVEAGTGRQVPEQALLQGFLDIANERMAEAIRKISVGEGFDPGDYAVVAFGGAGGLHACAIADILGVDTVLVPSDAGLLSAYGLMAAKVEQFEERQMLQSLEACLPSLSGVVSEMGGKALERLARDGADPEFVTLQPARFELRYKGQDSILVVEGGEPESLAKRFEEAYEAQFGFLPQGLTIELVTVRVVAQSEAMAIESETFSARRSSSTDKRYIDRSSLGPGETLGGPAVIQDPFSTTFLDAGWQAVVGTGATLKLRRGREASNARAKDEVVELELFTNRYLSIVDEMGALLERVAFSTNVKDRKDFSCALLDAGGRLVANAPHIPVHLGALGVCLRSVLASMNLEPGDVVVTNHPAFGGSHLPDVTLLAPVYSESDGALLGYVANRAHHAELGGVSPGSMPPDARSLEEEGVVIAPLKLVSHGSVNWDPLIRLLRESQFPSRALAENIADISAQLASIRRGATALRVLAGKEGSGRVIRFMDLLKRRAAAALTLALESRERGVTGAEERLDNGAIVKVAVVRDGAARWLVDFSGSAGVQPSNYNATTAIVTSAVMYVLRLLANQPIPLNEGMLDVVDIRIPTGMLNPDFPKLAAHCPAVVAGNVELSQLIVSALLKAFRLAACSQSTMNNFIFGTDSFGYYETIAGGEGATAERDGASGVHTHMTNTAMTDPEVMELRYPARIERFALRKGSGGKGLRCGGEGLIKRIRFLERVTLSLLTQRRVEAPFGMDGGSPGACGEQSVESADGGAARPLPFNGTVTIEPDDVVEIRTPGGGGWGRPG